MATLAFFDTPNHFNPFAQFLYLSYWLKKMIPRVVILLLLVPQLLLAQSSAPKYSNEFLAIGVGARALGMANSQVAIAFDVTAGYWNPAGLRQSPSTYEAAFMHAEYFAGIANYDYLAFATPIDDKSHLGISIIRFAVDSIPDTRFLFDANGAINYGNIRFFSAADYAFMLSYARELPLLGGIDVGGSVKIIHRTAGDFASAWGFGFDLGVNKRLNDWNFGVVVRDVTSTFNAWSHNSELLSDVYNLTGNEIPRNSVEITLPRMVLGVGRKFDLTASLGLLASFDAEVTFDGKRNTLVKSSFASIDPRLGIELDYSNKIFLRGGVDQFQQIKDFDQSTYNSFRPNFGLGLKLGAVTIDYALTDIGDNAESLYSHVFSIKAGFDKSNGK